MPRVLPLNFAPVPPPPNRPRPALAGQAAEPVAPATAAASLSRAESLALSAPRRGEVPTGTKPDIAGKLPAIEVFFTRPGIRPQDQSRPPEQALIDFILSAKQGIDIAAYEIENPRIRDAILAAHDKGRQVRIVIDDDHRNDHDLLALRAAGIPVVDDDRSGLMHNKFVVIDAGTPDAAVWTGSMNLTENCAWRNNNSALLIRSRELAENYRSEFDEMFVSRAFGRSSPSIVPHPTVTIGQTSIQTHFAAEGKVAAKVAATLNQARQSIHFMAFSFTHDAIGKVVAAKVSDKLTVRGVFEKTGASTPASEFAKLKALGAEVRTDGNPRLMHHKVFVVDAKTVIVGSFNFSESADQSNDENLLIIEDPELAARYLEEFGRVYDQPLD